MHVSATVSTKPIVQQYNNLMDKKTKYPANWKPHQEWPTDAKTGKPRDPKFPFRTRGGYPNWFERLCDDDATLAPEQECGKEKYANWDNELTEFAVVSNREEGISG